MQFRPHSQKQLDLINLFGDPANEEVWACCGRRYGKTISVAVAVIQFGSQNPTSPADAGEHNPRPTAIAIIGPDFQRAKRVYDEIVLKFKPWIQKQRDTDLKLTMVGGWTIDVWSGENIASIRGAGYDLVILDEAVGLSEVATNSDVIPTLADRNGRLWVISSPKFGKKNWFNRRYVQVRDAALKGTPFPNVKWFHATTFDNPKINEVKFLARLRNRGVDELTIREEYYAEILDQSSSWLDPSRINPIDAKFVPKNCFVVVIVDSAWAKPELIDRETRRRKDATVISVLGQDALGQVYCMDGMWDQHLTPTTAFELIAGYVKQYNVARIVKEKVADDPFASEWLAFARREKVRHVAVQTPSRGAGWKQQGIRYWAGNVLDRNKFFMVEGCPLYPHLVDEMEKYNEADSKNDKCPDDVLTTMQDILLAGVWQGNKEIQARDPKLGKNLYHLEDCDGYDRPKFQSKYSIR